MEEETEEYENHEDGKSSISADLIRGHINTIILRSLYDRDKYGYEIINEINEKSHGQYTLKQPTLYSALKRLETQGYIQAYWKSDEVSSGGRRKYFRLTDAGKEITEKNQAEWEYSRTVIDNLISDKNFDFSQPAPTPVDFKYLKQSTSRVPTLRGEGEEEKTDEESCEKKESEEKPAEQITAEPVIEAVTFTALHETSVILQPDEIPEELKEETAEEEHKAEEAAQPVVTEEVKTEPEKAEQQTEVPPATEQPVQSQPEPQQPVYSAPSALEIAAEEERLRVEREISEEQRRQAHENYVKLISGELDKKPETQEAPAAENLDAEKLIYNSRPETERDYRNLIDKLFVNTLKPGANEQPAPQPQEEPRPPVQETVIPAPVKSRFYDASEKAASDGLKIYTSENDGYSVKAKQSTYNKGATLFKCSLIVGVIILLEFTLCVLFKDSLNISLAYPFIILALGLADVLVCGILFGSGYGKQVRKPTNLRYIITSIITTVIIILIIVLFAILLSVNWSSTTEVLAKVVIPCIIALNIPIFTLSFYAFTK